MTQRVAIIDYGSGNLRSAAKAFERAIEALGADMQVDVTNESKRVSEADRIILPGVGAFADCLGGLSALDGMRSALDEAVLGARKPFLGICVGMQLMAHFGLEHGRHAGLGWIDGRVEPIRPGDDRLKVPHMGWNRIDPLRSHPLLNDAENGDHAYFVHSYHFHTADPDDTIAVTQHGGQVTAMVGRDNMVGTQFHPEKSQQFGLKLIENFLTWQPQ